MPQDGFVMGVPETRRPRRVSPSMSEGFSDAVNDRDQVAVVLVSVH
jgi:hypothetical protein